MSTWECRGCTAAYAPGAPRCPQCRTNDPINEAEQLRREQDMPKITVHGGPSNADVDPGQPGHVETDDDRHGDPVEDGQTATLEGDPGDTQAPEAVDYNTFTAEELRAELKERKLPTSGTKPELVDRLAENDDAKQQAGDAQVTE